MANPQQQQQPSAAPLGSMADWIDAKAWLEHEPNAIFPTAASLSWFIKDPTHRRLLVEAGALLPGRGRNGHRIHRQKFAEVALSILKQQALQGA
jgi:hypothetical protein